jgi:hypothetical protein
MSIFTQYHPETGVVFDELDDFIATLTAGGSGGTTPTATATPKATSTPSPGSRTAQIGGDWYVIDLNTGQAISPAYNTKSEAMYAAQYLFPATPVPTSTPSATATPAPAAAGQSLDPGLYSEDMLAMADVGAGPTAAVQSGGMGAIGGTTAPPPATGAAPPPATAGAKGGTTGTAGGTSAKPSAAPSQYAALLDQFVGFSDKDVVQAYYDGEITRDDLAALITLRNTNEKTGETKYTVASLDRYLKGVDDAKPPPRKQNALDVLGESIGNISNKWNTKDPQFGAPGAFGSSTAGAGIQSNNLYTAQSGGQGLIPMSTPGGNLGVAGAVVDNQLYPNRGATVPTGMVGQGQLNYSGSPASILAQSGVYVGNSSFADQMQALGNLIALREFFMTQNPSLSPSQANELAVGTMQPANPNQDPSAAALANWSDAPPPMQNFARGGGMTLKEPVLGMGMYSRQPLFMAAEAGNQERVESTGNGLKFTPTDKPYVSKWQPTRSTRALPATANQMAQSRAFGQRGEAMGMPQVGLPVEGRQGGRAPTTQMLALMRMLGIPGFATGGYMSYDEYRQPHLPATEDTRQFGSGVYPEYNLSDIGLGTSIEGGQIAPQSFLNAAASELSHQQTLTRQQELDQYNAALNDVAGISNVSRLERQRQAYDPRFGMAGMNLPIEAQAPLTGPMGALPPGVRWALESPAERQSRLSGLNEQQRAISLALLQNPSQQTQLALRDAIRDRDEDEIAELLGIDPELVEDIFNLLTPEGGGGSNPPPGSYPGYPVGGWGGAS